MTRLRRHRAPLGRRSLVCAALTALFLLTPIASAQPPSFMNFEASQTHPLAISRDGMQLFVVNTPDARLEIFDLASGVPTHVTSVPVGLEPVAVAVESATRVWVVNHLSDSISIVDVSATPPSVVRTLLVGDEPSDIVFAGAGYTRAFITTAHRGQNTADPRGAYATPGVDRADVWVFDAASLGTPFGGTPLTIVSLFGDVPRALARTPDGTRVYAAIFRSGNRTTTLNEGVVCNGGPAALPCFIETSVMMPGGLPAPTTNFMFQVGPEVGLIVRNNPVTGAWLDERGRDWQAAVRFDLPDLDVFEINAVASTPAEVGSFAGVGTVLYGMAVHPTDGTIYVANTDAINDVRFEGPGTFVESTGVRPLGIPSTVRGHQHESRITLIDGSTVTPRHLNPHIDYDADPVPADIRHRTLATPNAIAISGDGATLYVAALGSSAIGVIDTAELAAGTLSTGLSRRIPLRDPWPGGPTGLALDESRGALYVLTRFDNSIVTIDLETETVLGRSRMHSPEPEATIVGRPIFYDALSTSTNGEASCASCHVGGDVDGLAWDLGNPDDRVLSNPNPGGPIGGGVAFNPLKGPMTTQSFRGLADHGPMHWRGDRTDGHVVGGDPMDEHGAFVEFNVAFDGLLGRDEGPLSTEEMDRFASFAVDIMYPPNPIRSLDNVLREDEERGRNFYFTETVDIVTTCNGCHELDPSAGFFGGNGTTTFEGETQEFKVPHLRSIYQKVGMFGMPNVAFVDSATSFAHLGDQIRGFGYLHDGSIDSAFRFLHAGVFTGFSDDTERRDVEAYLMAFDTNLAPIVGQQVTIDFADSASITRAQLMGVRALTPYAWRDGTTTTECDVVAHIPIGGVVRGFLLEADGLFHSDRMSEAALDQLGLVAAADGAPITITCFPPGSGARAAYDRDEDGVRDGDERAAGTDPAGRAAISIPIPTVTDPPPILDGGVDLDAGMTTTDAAVPRTDGGVLVPDDGGIRVDGAIRTDAGDDTTAGGCGCRVTSGGSRGAVGGLALLAIAIVLRRRRRVASHATLSA